VLIYVHVPKCAGSTMFTFMKKQYKLLQIKRWHDFDWNIGKHVECLFGHFPYGVHKNLNSSFKNIQYATFLRDPVERVISLYYYIRWKKSNKQNEVFSNNTIEQLLEKRLHSAFDNDMVRFIAGRDDIGMYPPASKATLNDLELAKENLHKFDIFGFVNTFDHDFKRFGKQFHWNTNSYEVRGVGKRPKKGELSQTTLAMIEEHTQLDQELYTYAKSL